MAHVALDHKPRAVSKNSSRTTPVQNQSNLLHLHQSYHEATAHLTINHNQEPSPHRYRTNITCPIAGATKQPYPAASNTKGIDNIWGTRVGLFILTFTEAPPLRFMMGVMAAYREIENGGVPPAPSSASSGRIRTLCATERVSCEQCFSEERTLM